MLITNLLLYESGAAKTFSVFVIAMPTHKMQGCHRVVNALSKLSGLSRGRCLFWHPPELRLSTKVVTVTNLGDNTDNPKVVNGL